MHQRVHHAECHKGLLKFISDLMLPSTASNVSGRGMSTRWPAQVLDDAAAVDAKYEAGESILPLCGLPLAVKDAIDVVRFLPRLPSFAFHIEHLLSRRDDPLSCILKVGYPTTAATPGLASK